MALSAVRADQTPKTKLRAIEEQIDQNRAQQEALNKKAEALAQELEAIRTDIVAAAEAAQAHERVLSALEAQLASLSAEEAQKSAKLARDRAHEAELLSALARLARNPPEALALGPMTPEDAIRSGLLLGATVPRLQAEAESLQLQLADLRRLRADIARKRLAATAEQRGLDDERRRLSDLVERKTALRDQTLHEADDSAQRMAQLSAQAKDLRELIERLEAARKAREEAERRAAAERAAQIAALPKSAPDTATSDAVAAPPPALLDASRPKTIRSFADARGAMLYPASGKILRRYGENDDFGMSSKGLTLMTRPGAVVVAPFDGRIEFAGPFKGYGQLLIIQHGDGYHSLLAGLDRIDGKPGDWLVAGEPVGAMATDDPKPRLYLELRHDGQPINPLPWLATRDEKVSG